MRTLRQISEACNSNKLRNKYEPFYERVLGHLRNQPITIVEIGIFEGGSLRMWRDYFPNAQVYGFDVRASYLFTEDRITTMLVDQSDRAQLEAAMREIGPADVILDDGSHRVIDQQISLGYLFQHVKPGGYYIVEDVQSSYFYDGYAKAEAHARIKGIAIDLYNTTYVALKNYEQFGVMKSQYMTPDELAHLNQQIASCQLDIRNNFRSVTCALQKRAEETA